MLFARADHVEDLGRALFHVEDDRVDAADQIVICGVAGDCDRQPGGGANQGLPDAGGELADMGSLAGGLDLAKDVHETQDSAEQAEQGCDLGDGGEDVEFLLEAWDFPRAGVFESFVNGIAAAFAIEDGDFDQASNRAGRGVANGDGFDGVVALEDVANTVQELGGVNLFAVVLENAFEENSQSHGAGKHDDPHHWPAIP